MIKHLPLLFTVTLLFLPSVAHAQTYQPTNRTPVTDNTLGTQVSGTNNNFEITGGLNRGQNLFHSFTDFSVPTGGSANFTNPAGNRSIITRVTGNFFSDLNGLVNTNGANFLLINPNGVVFGTDARLNVGKAFVTSTANGIDFVDAAGRTFTFGVNRAGDAPLLSIDPNVAFDPARLIMGGTIPGIKGIENYGTLQTNNPGQYIGLISGNVSFNGGQIDAPGGRVDLGGLSVPGTVGLGVEGDLLRAQFPTNVTRGDVSFTNRARVSVAGSGGGDVAITARNLEILSTSVVRGGIEAGLGTPEAVAGDIKLDATGELVIAGSNTAIANSVRSNSKGNGGNTTINAGSFSLRDGAQIQALTFGQGNAGNVNVKVAGAVDITGIKDGFISGISSYVDTGTIGNAGNITIDAGSFSLQDGAQLESSTYGTGNAGNVTVMAKDGVSLADGAYILSTIQAGGVGKGGNISIDAGSLLLRDGVQLVTATIGASDTQPAGKGDAGNVIVTVSGAVDIVGTKDGFASTIFSDVGTGTKGNGGNITINAGSFSLKDGAQLVASTSGIGNAGNVTVKADAVSLVDASIFSTVEAGGVGNGGNITIDAGSLSLRDSAQLITSTRKASDTQPAGKGDAGNVNVKVSGAVDITGTKDGLSSGIFSLVATGTEGNGGNITINAGSFSLRDGTQLTASTFGTGNAGNVTVTAKDAVSLVDADILSTVAAGGVGKGGNISIDAGSLSLRDSAQLITITRKASDTQPAGKGDAGNVNVKVSGAVDITGTKDGFSSGIRSSVDTGTVGKGGNITIDADSLSLRDGAQLAASTYGTGNAGNIGIKAKGDITLAGTVPTVYDLATNNNKSVISSSSFGVGDAGKISIDNPSGKLSLSFSNITTTIGGLENKNATGISQGVNINARELEIKNNSAIVSDLFGKGQAGNIDIKTTGNITISGNNKDPLQVTPFNLSGISSNTRGIGDGGKISIETPGKLSLDSTGFIGSAINKDAQGTSQGIKINVGELNLTDFGVIGSDTLGENPGGDIEIIAKGAVNIKNSTIQANSIKFTATLNIPGGNNELVSSTGEGKAGNISISSDRLNLDGGVITSLATSDAGGNITLNLSDKLLLRNNSTISTSSGEDFGKDFGGGTGGGNGGNITINSPLIVALPNVDFGNDITANAFTGTGGNVSITSQGLFGIQFRPKGSRLTNDITASSTFGQSGSVQISTPGTDPGRDSTELPNTTTDASNQISQACSANNRQNKLTVTGRGGLPPNANDPLTSDVVWQDARAASSQPAASNTTINPVKLAPPAVGWVFNGKGKVTLIEAGSPGQPTTGTSVVCPQKVR